MVERRMPTREEALTCMHEKRHGGQRGADDQVGTFTLLMPATRVNTVAGGSSLLDNLMALF